MNETGSLRSLRRTLPQTGRVVWIGLRPARGQPMRETREVRASPGQGLIGDRFSGRSANPREVTLLQHEHLAVIAACLGVEAIDPASLRRNILVRGINLLALKEGRIRVGEAEFEMTGQCHPCSRMERALGAGGYNAMRGHGGITARVLRGGLVGIGAPVGWLAPAAVNGSA